MSEFSFVNKQQLIYFNENTGQQWKNLTRHGTLTPSLTNLHNNRDLVVLSNMMLMMWYFIRKYTTQYNQFPNVGNGFFLYIFTVLCTILLVNQNIILPHVLPCIIKIPIGATGYYAYLPLHIPNGKSTDTTNSHDILSLKKLELCEDEKKSLYLENNRLTIPFTLQELLEDKFDLEKINKQSTPFNSGVLTLKKPLTPTIN